MKGFSIPIVRVKLQSGRGKLYTDVNFGFDCYGKQVMMLTTVELVVCT